MYSYILLVSDHDEVAMYPTVNKQLITNKPTVKLKLFKNYFHEKYLSCITF